VTKASLKESENGAETFYRMLFYLFHKGGAEFYHSYLKLVCFTIIFMVFLEVTLNQKSCFTTHT
jgi:hypothetical protein